MKSSSDSSGIGRYLRQVLAAGWVVLAVQVGLILWQETAGTIFSLTTVIAALIPALLIHWAREWAGAVGTWAATGKAPARLRPVQRTLGKWMTFLQWVYCASILFAGWTSTPSRSGPVFGTLSAVVVFMLLRRLWQWTQAQTGLSQNGTGDPRPFAARLVPWLLAGQWTSGAAVVCALLSAAWSGVGFGWLVSETRAPVAVFNAVLSSAWVALVLAALRYDVAALAAPLPGQPLAGPPAPPRRSPRPASLLIGTLGLLGLAAWLSFGQVAGRGRAAEARATYGLPSGFTAQGQPYYGRADAPITVTEYLDYQCPGCQSFDAFERDTFLRAELEAGQVKLVTADLPLPFHQNAVPSALAAHCAADLGHYWAYRQRLFASQAAWKHAPDPAPQFLRMARSIGLPTAPFQSCLQSGKHLALVNASLKRAEALDLPGTPPFTVNGKPVPWAPEGTVDAGLRLVEQAVGHAQARR